ncbi:hypothetical protein KUTeg_009971 [Tegillarca granosa]|uniref:Uncharacterized protein n=1 Tax=Tegillarca granosa TaxID=220873 RepID=A0ABQ9FAD5_TEGGR|nr:hypothetical protein KUTeg_009971 [Tegillarca granosa]
MGKLNKHSIIKSLEEEDKNKPIDDKTELDLDSTEKRTSLLYTISDRPPVHLTILFAFQQALLPLSSSLAISFIVADVVCAGNNEDIKTKLLSSTLLMNGVTTLLMVTVGIRLPLFQSAASDYIVPLLVMASLNPDQCNPSIVRK